MLVLWNACGEPIYQMEDSSAGGEVADDARPDGYAEHTAKKRGNGSDQLRAAQLRAPSSPRNYGKANSQWQSDPPSGNNAPEEAEHCRRIGVDQTGVANREILYADSRSDLIVKNPINDRRAYRCCDDCGCLHGRIS